MALKIILHAKLCLSVITFFSCVCWHAAGMCRALFNCGQRGQVILVEQFKYTACFWLHRVLVLYFIIVHWF